MFRRIKIFVLALTNFNCYIIFSQFLFIVTIVDSGTTKRQFEDKSHKPFIAIKAVVKS